MANIACGFHASDPSVMANTIQLAKKYNVCIGAHVGYPDLQGFGRRKMSLTADEIIHMVQYQVGALTALCQVHGVQVEYVKPHGAMYNTMMEDEQVRDAIMKSIAQLSEGANTSLSLMVLANDQAEKIAIQAKQYSVTLLFEAFADRAYNDDGCLVSRNESGAVLEDDEAIQAHVLGLINHQQIESINGNLISIQADTICVHGDNSQALQSVKNIRQLIV